MPLTDAASAMWEAPDGTQILLTGHPDLGWHTLPAVTGLGAAPVTLVTDPDPKEGVRVRHVSAPARVITWGIHVWGADHQEFVDRWRYLARAFTQTRRRGPGVLTVTNGEVSREIEAYYQGGFDNDPEDWYREADVVLSFLSEDPYWRDAAATEIRREYTAGSSYFAPYMTVSSGQVLGSSTLVNPGDADAWPEIAITGPFSLVTATKLATNETWTLNPSTAGLPGGGPVLAGQTVKITTRRPSVRGPNGEVWTGALNWPTAELWGLDQGDNPVQLTVSGSGPGTAIVLSFKARRETA